MLVFIALAMCLVHATPAARAEESTVCLSSDHGSLNVPVVVMPMEDVAKSTAFPNATIFLDPSIGNFTMPAQSLIRAHECHHATHNWVNEDQADFYAGEMMFHEGLSSETTENAAREVFSRSNTARDHSGPMERIASVMNGYWSAAGRPGVAVAGDAPLSCSSAGGNQRNSAAWLKNCVLPEWKKSLSTDRAIDSNRKRTAADVVVIRVINQRIAELEQ